MKDINLQIAGYDKATFSVEDWKARYVAVGLEEYFEAHRTNPPRSILFNPEMQDSDKVFVLEPA